MAKWFNGYMVDVQEVRGWEPFAGSPPLGLQFFIVLGGIRIEGSETPIGLWILAHQCTMTSVKTGVLGWRHCAQVCWVTAQPVLTDVYNVVTVGDLPIVQGISYAVCLLSRATTMQSHSNDSVSTPTGSASKDPAICRTLPFNQSPQPFF